MAPFLALGLSWAPFLEPLGSILGGLRLHFGSLGVLWCCLAPSSAPEPAQRRFWKRRAGSLDPPLGSQNGGNIHVKLVEKSCQKSNLKMSDLAAEFGKSNSNVKLSEFHRGANLVDTVGIYGGTGRARYGSEYDGNDGLTTVKPIPCLTYNDGRSRIRTSSTGTPTVALLTQDSATAQASLGNFTGLCLSLIHI